MIYLHIRSIKSALSIVLLVSVFSLPLLLFPGVQGLEQLSISINITNEDETNVVNGVVTDQDQLPVEGAEVSIQVNDPSGEIVHLEFTVTDNDGKFSDWFKTSEGVNGEYSIFVSVNKAGYNVNNIASTFAVIPEFSLTFLVIIVALLSVVLLLKKNNSLSDPEIK